MKPKDAVVSATLQQSFQLTNLNTNTTNDCFSTTASVNYAPHKPTTRNPLANNGTTLDCREMIAQTSKKANWVKKSVRKRVRPEDKSKGVHPEVKSRGVRPGVKKKVVARGVKTDRKTLFGAGLEEIGQVLGGQTKRNLPMWNGMESVEGEINQQTSEAKSVPDIF